MKKIAIILLIILKTFSSFSNGGSISEGSFVRGGNSIKLLTEGDFKLESEDLSIYIEEDFIDVNVTYQIVNLGKNKTLKYGFAIDFRDHPQTEEGFYDDFTWEDDYIQNFTILNNSKQINYTIKTEENVRIEESNYSRRDIMPRDDTISRKWYISELNFEANETKQLKVSYRIKSNYADWDRKAIDNLFYPAGFSNRLFRYFLKPSGFWGDGTVTNFKLQISFDDIDKYDIEISGIQNFKKENDAYTFQAANFNLLDTDYLKLSYNYSKWLSTEEAISYNDSNGLIKNYNCSGQNPKYPVSNLFDHDKNTTFVPLNNSGINEWINIEFIDDIRLFGIIIINGYPKTKQTYFNNNIVSELKISIKFEGTNYEEIVYLERKENDSKFEYYFVGIEDLIWGDILIGHTSEYDYMSDISEYDYAYGKAISMKIEILGIDEGAKYDDTCISEIMIYGKKYSGNNEYEQWH